MYKNTNVMTYLPLFFSECLWIYDCPISFLC